MKFKVGDRVERTACHATGMEVGDIVTVRNLGNNGEVFIEGYEYAHSANFFKLAPSESDALADAVKWEGVLAGPFDNRPELTIESLVEGNAELGETIKALEEEIRGHRREYEDVAKLIRKMVEPGLPSTEGIDKLRDRYRETVQSFVRSPLNNLTNDMMTGPVDENGVSDIEARFQNED